MEENILLWIKEETYAGLECKSFNLSAEQPPGFRIATEKERNDYEYSMNGKVGFSSKIPRVGYYQIKEVYLNDFMGYGITRKEYFAKAIYCRNASTESFQDDGNEILIRLQPLFNFHSESVNKIYYNDQPKLLTNKKIHIESVNLVWNSPEMKYQTYKIVWSVLNDQISS